VTGEEAFLSSFCFCCRAAVVFYALYPVFWAIPTMMLSESAAAATFD